MSFDKGGEDVSSREQRAYASLMDICMKMGLVGMAACFLVYVSGIAPEKVHLESLPQYWSMPLHEYLRATGTPTGWGWVGLLVDADFLNILPIAFLSMITIICCLRILPMMIARMDRIYSGIIVAEIAVLALAASGVLTGGH